MRKIGERRDPQTNNFAENSKLPAAGQMKFPKMLSGLAFGSSGAVGHMMYVCSQKIGNQVGCDLRATDALTRAPAKWCMSA